MLKEGEKINTFPVEEYWSDIGTLDQYVQSTKDFFDKKVELNHSELIKTPKGQYIKGENSYIAPSALIFGNNVIGNKCIIGKNVILENCVLWDDVEIADNVILKNCIIASHSEIKSNLANQIIGPNQVISSGAFN